MMEPIELEPRNWYCEKCREWLPTHDEEMDLQRRHLRCKTKAVWRPYPICLTVPCSNLPEQKGP